MWLTVIFQDMYLVFRPLISAHEGNILIFSTLEIFLVLLSSVLLTISDSENAKTPISILLIVTSTLIIAVGAGFTAYAIAKTWNEEDDEENRWHRLSGLFRGFVGERNSSDRRITGLEGFQLDSFQSQETRRSKRESSGNETANPVLASAGSLDGADFEFERDRTGTIRMSRLPAETRGSRLLSAELSA